MENVEVELKRIMRAERNFDIYIYIYVIGRGRNIFIRFFIKIILRN